ncbi:glycerate kinase family protein [Enterococcus massiliensis]|uniref:glycerate kinase family protein n=1 Tax=Enterococcus massiliensis TaxID=1640685 RepID=UPI00065E138C|nr:glycerate kinase [Enterococcus massiliensis]
MKVVAAIDSFKGSASSEELNRAVLNALPADVWTEKLNVPIADGGEGTIEALRHALGGELISFTSLDPLGRPVVSRYLMTDFKGQQTAFIESAAIIGIHLVQPSDKAVRQGSTYGLGLLIKDAVAHGAQVIYVSLGGSGTSDGGLGLLQGLGGKIKTASEGNPLLTISDFDLEPARQEVTDITLIALADVTNPYVGENGFAEIFGPQKGAETETIKEMNKQAKKVSEKILKKYGIDLANEAGAGAAGGLGGAILALDGKIQPGFTTISRLIGLEEKVKDATLIFTGEGRLDAQTAQGKVPFGVATLATREQIPVIGVCGSRAEDIGELAELFLGVFSIQQSPVSLEEAMKKETTLKNIGLTASSLANVFYWGKQND